MNSTEVYLVLILIISLLSLWFSWKSYSKKMKGMNYLRRSLENYKDDCDPYKCPASIPFCCGDIQLPCLSQADCPAGLTCSRLSGNCEE